MFHSLLRFAEVHHLGGAPLNKGTFLNRALRRLGSSGRVTKDSGCDPAGESREFCSRVENELHFPVVRRALRPAASRLAADLRTTLPLVYLSNATFALMRDYYQDFAKLPPSHAECYQQMEARIIARAALCVFSSQWAADSAVRDYGASPAKVRVIPFGANLDGIPPAADVLVEKGGRECNLLFMGKDWQRKGGAVAADALESLREMGIATNLVVVGGEPPDWRKRGIHFLGMLNKGIPAQAREYYRLYAISDFMILPTRAELRGRRSSFPRRRPMAFRC